MDSGADEWTKFSKDYDKKVFSLTKFPERRAQIISKVRGERVVNLGTGPTPYLNQDLTKRGYHVVATDFCLAMLNAAKRKFKHRLLKYQRADSRKLPFEEATFDTAISVNSILPETRREVSDMVGETYYILKPGGVFIAFLCSFDSVRKAESNGELKIEIDSTRLRVHDTVGWQCYHTRKSIDMMVRREGFEEFTIEKVLLNTPGEVKELKRLYGVDTSTSPMWEYLLTAIK